jgi:hypothetical protein
MAQLKIGGDRREINPVMKNKHSTGIEYACGVRKKRASLLRFGHVLTRRFQNTIRGDSFSSSVNFVGDRDADKSWTLAWWLSSVVDGDGRCGAIASYILSFLLGERLNFVQ